METLKQNTEISTVLIRIALSAWFLSLVLPAEQHVGFGIVFLLFGWVNMFAANFAWLANIFAFMAYIQMRDSHYRSGLWLSVLAFVTSLQTVFMTSIKGGIDDNFHIPVWQIGYYVWELSFVLMIVFSLYLLLRQKKAQTKSPITPTTEPGVSA